MRLDKWLKVSRLIKRRTVANEACDNARVMANGRSVKASYDVKVGDVLELKFGEKTVQSGGSKQMNKAELVMAIAEKTQMTKKDSEAALVAALDAITAALADGERVQLVGFGSFEVKTRAERLGRNPKTGESVAIPASKSPVFKAAKNLKDAVNG